MTPSYKTSPLFIAPKHTNTKFDKNTSMGFLNSQYLLFPKITKKTKKP